VKSTNGEGRLLGPVIYEDDFVCSLHIGRPDRSGTSSSRADGTPYVDDLTDAEAEAIGRVTSRLAHAADAHLLAEIVRLDRAHHRPVAGDSDLAEHVKVATRAHQTMIPPLG
jgi:hypothetical protein